MAKDPEASKSVGRRGEELARGHLRRLGYKIVARNFTCPVGEVDLIALDGDTLVFVEVKTLQQEAGIDPVEQVHAGKQAHIRRVARFYISAKQAEDMPARFDVLAVTMGADGEPHIEHIEDAF